jgi:hypothetical protein
MDGTSELDLSTRLAGLVRVSPPFVGRRQEFDWLIRGLAEAMGGQPRLVLMPGEAGIGKSRLLLEVQAQARRRGVQVGLGRCYEDLTLPYLPFVGAWRTLIEQVPQDVMRTSAPIWGLSDGSFSKTRLLPAPLILLPLRRPIKIH